MQAPLPDAPRLTYERVRCQCQTDNLLVFPDAWYKHQRDAVVERDCVSCGRSLLELYAPEGAVVQAWGLGTVPDAVARQLGADLADELGLPRDPPVTGELPAAWCEPHEASAAYVEWVQAQPPPVADDPWPHRRQDLLITAGLVVAVIGFVLTG